MQSFTDYEIIVINDGSKDNSEQIIKSYVKANAGKITLISQENQGVIASRNNAIRQAKGKYILPIDGDDMLTPNTLEKLYSAMISGKGDVICGHTCYFGAKNGIWDLPEPSDEHDFLERNVVVCSALYRKSDWELFGGYDPGMAKGCEDWEFWLNFVEARRHFHRINHVTLMYRIAPDSRNHTMSNETIQQLLDYMNSKHQSLVHRRNSLRYYQSASIHASHECAGISVIRHYLDDFNDVIPTKAPELVNFICGGTYSNERFPDKLLIMLGCGCLPVDEFHNNSNKLKVYSLRGKLSKKYVCPNEDIVLGDIALLISKVYQPENQERKLIGIIPDIVHFNAPQLDKYRNNPNYLVINTQQDTRLIANEINRCACVVSSSLFGLILADSYGIPNVRLIIKDLPTLGGDFIFEDYYSAVGRTGKAATSITPEEIESIDNYDTSYFAYIKCVQENLENAVRTFVKDIPMLRKMIAFEKNNPLANHNENLTPDTSTLTPDTSANCLTRAIYLKQHESQIKRAYRYCRIMASLTWGKRSKKYTTKKHRYRSLLKEIETTAHSIIS